MAEDHRGGKKGRVILLFRGGSGVALIRSDVSIASAVIWENVQGPPERGGEGRDGVEPRRQRGRSPGRDCVKVGGGG